MQLNNLFIHHVYFWLKNIDNVDDMTALIVGLKKLSTITTIQQFHIGKPATPSKDVIDGSYAISWCLLFASKEDEAEYQTHPIHLNFIKECNHLWSKVVVYDSVDV